MDSVVASARDPLQDTFSFHEWKFSGSKGHILTKAQEESWNQELNLPHLPDMVFASNRLRLEHQNLSAGIEFNPMDALKCVNDHEDLVHVSVAKDWLEARKDSPHINKIIHPFDWTFTPRDYRGTMFGDVKISRTEERINYRKLQEREKILFFQEIILYEDELDDNGCSVLTAKLRVMPSSFFCLLRFYLRVDKTLVRVYDTRLFHEFSTNFMLREYTERESKTDELQVPPAIWRDQNEIVNHLKLQKETREKLEFTPSS